MSLIEGFKASGLLAEDLGPPVAFDSWTDAVRRSVLRFDFDCDRPGVFSGTLSDRSVAGVSFVDMECERHAAHRGRDSISAEDAGYYVLTLQLSGRLRLSQGDSSVVLTPGYFAIYDSGEPTDLVSSDGYKSSCIKFPKQRVGADGDSLEPITARAFECAAGMTSAAWTMILALNRNLDSLGDNGPLAVRGMMDLVTTMLRDELGQHQRVSDRRDALCERVSEYIDAHLADPDLTPGSIAAAHHVSLRHLHAAFEPTDHTVASLIRLRRLERCQRDLSDPLLAHVPVAAIAARWGFADASHFGQVFKRHTGLPPGEFRRGVLPHRGRVVAAGAEPAGG
ncbi:AraC-like ligand-binding domain-containing protein [Halostreptopolyspora alba]|uniref:AraC-like ligand-binding domain-containing protein n=1 Tax=Halostreptopolyspora alba TaxID=2487137 RepID=UPI0026A84030